MDSFLCTIWAVSCEDIAVDLRLKPRKRLVLDKPQSLSVTDGINEVWSIDFMQDQLDRLLQSRSARH